MKEENKIDQLRKELELGEQSGMIEDFDPEKWLEKIKEKYIPKK